MILCDTPADNYVARQFFEKLGFGDPINHVYMSRNLSQIEPSSSSNENQASSGGGNDDEREAETPSRRVSRRSGRAGENGRDASPRISPTAAAAPSAAPKKRRKCNVDVREMIIDDLHEVYELGEGVFGDRSSPNLFRFWEPAEVLDLFETDSEFCLVAELDDKIVGTRAWHPQGDVVWAEAVKPDRRSVAARVRPWLAQGSASARPSRKSGRRGSTAT